MVKAKDKKNRMLEIFYRAMVGGNINTKALADEYGVSGKSISRDIGEIKNFLSDNRDLVNYKDLRYSASSKTYHLEFDHVLLSKELIAIIKVLIGCRAFSKEELLTLISKLKAFTSHQDRALLDQIITKEVYHYNEVGRDCESVIDNLWKLTRCIKERQEISISYYKVDREPVERRIMPIAITFSDYYFYLIAYRCDTEDWTPLYFRVDRITHITEHRTHFTLAPEHDFDVGKLRDKIQFMFPGNSGKSNSPTRATPSRPSSTGSPPPASSSRMERHPSSKLRHLEQALICFSSPRAGKSRPSVRRNSSMKSGKKSPTWTYSTKNKAHWNLRKAALGRAAQRGSFGRRRIYIGEKRKSGLPLHIRKRREFVKRSLLWKPA